ncbi:MAG: argininosuccinate synthase [Gammaproteobacteria bacterium]
MNTEAGAKAGAVKKAVLAYSGGLDTSVILLWLREEYNCEVVAFTADIGQGEETETARQKALQFGAVEARVEDLREVFARDYVFPMLRANAVYEHGYLLGTSIARPLIAKRQAEIARQTGADALAHGATGKGNDQVRFELAFLALAPDVKVIAPWREWQLSSRQKLMDYARARNVPIEEKRGKSAPYSMDANLLHISYEGGELEDPAAPPSADMWRRTRAILDAPDDGEEVRITFLHGDPVGVNGKTLTAAQMIETLNVIGGKHGIGRADIVENRYVGLKSRGCYETPGGDILHTARRALETITLDREVMHLRAELMPKYAALVYNGYWWSPERQLLQRLFDESQLPVCGEVRLLLQKGRAIVIGRESDNSLYDQTAATFEEDAGAFDQRDAEGFIRLNALRLRQSAKR